MDIKHIRGLSTIIENLGLNWIPETPTVEIDTSYSGTGIKTYIYNNSGEDLYSNFKGITEIASFSSTGVIRYLSDQDATYPFNVLFAYDTVTKQINTYESALATIPDELSLNDDEILISRFQIPASGSAVVIPTIPVIKKVITQDHVKYWYNTINDQVSGYLYDSPANADTALDMLVCDKDYDSSISYSFTKFNFYYIDDLSEEVTSPVIQVRINRGGTWATIATNTTINPGNNDLLANMPFSGVKHEDRIGIYITTGTGTSAGSQIHGDLSYELTEN